MEPVDLAHEALALPEELAPNLRHSSTREYAGARERRGSATPA